VADRQWPPAGAVAANGLRAGWAGPSAIVELDSTGWARLLIAAVARAHIRPAQQPAQRMQCVAATAARPRIDQLSECRDTAAKLGQLTSCADLHSQLGKRWTLPLHLFSERGRHKMQKIFSN